MWIVCDFVSGVLSNSFQYKQIISITFAIWRIPVSFSRRGGNTTVFLHNSSLTSQRKFQDIADNITEVKSRVVVHQNKEITVSNYQGPKVRSFIPRVIGSRRTCFQCSYKEGDHDFSDKLLESLNGAMLGYVRQLNFKNCPVLLELFAEDHPNTTLW